ncbi:uncharacterized protein LOC121729737 [Aricia agestis]|uniref:uncharacterized protein LOC121729737 n=1 Tax=Aricia agestis TaxID=91739 RepID=UPI001C2084A2|nr:uncharacterized protein LOC121729737 [Aricia agestis]XP_041974279.1 uncharacterized protein LOC121729737 [Aricia agestis]
MWNQIVFLLCLFIAGQCQETPLTPAEVSQISKGEEKMSEYILQLLEHFKQPDPVGLPGAKVPDPYMIPDNKQSTSFGTMYFKKTGVHGISKFRILYVNVDIAEMKVVAGLSMDKLQARGDYTMSTWLNKVQGPYTVDITGLKLSALATLGVERDGKIRAQNMIIDIGFNSIVMDFQNAGFLGGMLQGLVNTMGPVLFDSIKPFILKEAYTKAREEINKKIEEISGDMQFPNSISPLDMLIVDVRKRVREMDLDPYRVKNYNTTMSIFTVTLTDTWIIGISSFQRVGNITLKLVNNTVIADFEIGTQKLEGITHWEISAVGGLVSRAGSSSFSVDYISGRIVLGQPLDTRKKPEFRNLELDIGNIQVRFDGAGTLDYLIEFIINVLPNILRYQIVDALEGPLQEKVQQELNRMNVEEMIKDELPKVDEMEEAGFKLSALQPQTVEEPYDEDEFFNF